MLLLQKFYWLYKKIFKNKKATQMPGKASGINVHNRDA